MAKTNLTPGTMLKAMLDKNGLNCNSLSKEIKCSQTALRLISLDKSRITTSIALRLAKFFNTDPEYWLVAQMKFDLVAAAKNKSLNKMLNGISKVNKKTAAKKVPKAKTRVQKTARGKKKAKPRAKR